MARVQRQDMRMVSMRAMHGLGADGHEFLPYAIPDSFRFLCASSAPLRLKGYSDVLRTQGICGEDSSLYSVTTSAPLGTVNV